MTTRRVDSQPGIIILLTSKGGVKSPPLEWREGAVEHRFPIPENTWVSAYKLVHPDGSLIHEGDIMEHFTDQHTYTVRFQLEKEDPNG